MLKMLKVKTISGLYYAKLRRSHKGHEIIKLVVSWILIKLISQVSDKKE